MIDLARVRVSITFLSICTASLTWLLPQAVFSQDTLWQRLTDEAKVYLNAGKYADADRCFKAALTRAKQLGNDSELITSTYHDLALLEYARGHYRAAEPMFRRSIDAQIHCLKRAHAISDGQAVGQACEDLVKEKSCLADCYRADLKYKQAESLYRSALQDEHDAGQEGSVLHANIQHELGDVLSLQGRYAEAEALYKKALPVLETNRCDDMLLDLLQDYDVLLRITNRTPETVPLEKKCSKSATGTSLPPRPKVFDHESGVTA